jgi:predicted transglutaminase-like cysteine proteinase
MAELQNVGAGDGAGREPVADELVAQDGSEQGGERGVSTGSTDVRQEKRDLSQDPQFREFQRSYDQKLNAMQQQLAAAQAKADDAAMAGMDDYERKDFLLEKERREKEDLLQQLQMTVAERYKAEGLAALAKQYDVPVDVLDDRSPEAAEASALRYQLAQLKKQQGDSQAQETATRNRVDVGGGGAVNGEAVRLRAQLKQARESNDTRRYLSLVNEARARGVTVS